MMKLSFLLASLACALVINSKAETVWQQIGRGLDNLGNAAMHEEARKEAQEQAEYQAALAQAKAEHEKWVQKMYHQQDLRNQARDAAFAEDAKSDPFYHTDALPLWNQYDSIVTIKVYLHDSGNDVSDTEASKVRSYMLAHGIKHVSQLAQ
jgi:Flp pilus assembly protein TadG